MFVDESFGAGTPWSVVLCIKHLVATGKCDSKPSSNNLLFTVDGGYSRRNRQTDVKFAYPVFTTV